jgi:hypothetical protein
MEFGIGNAECGKLKQGRKREEGKVRRCEDEGGGKRDDKDGMVG